MATQVKLTIKRGQKAKDVVAAAGSAISGSDALELNIDVSGSVAGLSRGEIRVLLKELDIYLNSHGWPLT